jgi:hypothetical protein
MYGSVEMLSRSFAEKLLSESVVCECAGKMMPCTSGEIFQWDRTPISIGGTLHLPASALRFISLRNLYQESFRISSGAVCAISETKNETKKNDPLRRR